jgi:NADPH:quinone reductase-like Zn-dependent oxidoreductase
VVEIGPDVDAPRVGDRVAVSYGVACGDCDACVADREYQCRYRGRIGLYDWGGYAEYVVVPARTCVPIPASLSFAEATVIVRHFPTAFQLLETKAGLKLGEWVLVMGAAGALGSCGVQVGKYLGATVIAGAGADERVQAALTYGADYGVNYRTQDLEQEVLRLTDGHGVDVVFENIADPTLWQGAFNSLAPNGRLVTAGSHGGGMVTLDVTRLYLRRLRIVGSPGAMPRDVQQSLEAAATGRLRAIIGRIMPLREAAEAHRLLEGNAVIGKIILDPTL